MNQIKIAQARKNRLAKQQAGKDKAEAKKLEAIFELQNKTIQTLHDNLEKSYTELKGSIDNITIPEYEQKFTDINNTLVKLIGKLEAGINVNNLKDIKQQGDVTVKNLKDITNKVSVTNLKDIKLDTKGLVKDKTLSELDRTLANIANQLGQLDEKLEPKQKPENFMPIRRVIKVGNRLEFDDSSWGGRSGGGSTITSPIDTHELTGLVPEVYDYISLSYTGDNITGVVYKVGGSGGSTVATLTIAYSGANITSVTRT